jgi:predicted rRNA methylase YqxC with S4 and FtsJ domains
VARDAVVERVCRVLAEDEGVRVLQTMESPVTGREGNREVLLLVGLADPHLLPAGNDLSFAGPER